MSELPQGWEWATIGELCAKPQYGWTSKSSLDADGFPYLRTTDITKGPVDWSQVPRCLDNPPDEGVFLLTDGDIVVSRAGSVGASALLRTPPKAVFASYLIRLRVIPPVIPSYLRFFLQSPAYWQQISDAKVGIAVQNVNASKLSAISLPLPSVAEQRRIIAAVEEHLSRLDAAEAALRSAASRVDHLLVASRAAAFSPSWPMRPLCTVADTQLGKMLSSKSRTGVGSTPYLRNRNVRWGSVDLSDVAVMDFTREEQEKFRLADGDVLICEGGAGVGRTAMWRGELEVCCYQKALHRVRTGPELLSEFLVMYLRHFVESRQLQRHLSGVAIGHFPQEDLRALHVPVPRLADQRRLLEALGTQEAIAEVLKAALRDAMQRARALRRSILASAFSGRLVPQDPNDEPASVLLERIRAERAAAVPVKRTRKVKRS